MCSPTYVLLEAYYVLLEVYFVLLKTSIFKKYIMFSLKFIVFSSKFIVFSSKFIVFSSKFIMFSLKFIVFSSEVYYVLLKKFPLTQENTFRHPKSASLLVFYSGEHFTTIRNLQVYLCSTQENTLRQSKISKFDCVPLRRTIYNYQKLTSLLVFYYSREQFTP